VQSFEVKDDFYLDGKPFKIMSGAIHYFRVHPDDWYHSLYNLKALGFNTVETYVPWNLHEPKEGTFDFEAGLDLGRFLDIAADLGLYAIVRPSPFICAEWELGGLPAWLLTDRTMRPRSADPRFLDKVAAYYDELMARLVPHQLTHGGNVIMMQVENEYGSYGEEKPYLRALVDLMRGRGVDVELCTSDGPWRACLRAGSLADDGILATGNFGSHARENFSELKSFNEEHGHTWPLMCMEFWDGWFNRWGEPVVRRDPQELADSVREALELGSVNLYMFHGGTNFGFMNGCSARGRHDLHQVTSYDYDAPLDEQGNPTPKYFALKAMVHDLMPDLPQAEPLVKGSLPAREVPLTGKVALASTLEGISDAWEGTYPVPMEQMGQAYGYVLYRTTFERDAAEERLRVIDASDRVQVLLNGTVVATQYQEEVGEDIDVRPRPGMNELDILVENMGRVNYGHKLLADTQHKGIRTGVCADLHFMCGWKAWSLTLASADGIDFSGSWQQGQPAFYRYELDLGRPADTFVDLTGFGKGCVLVNGTNVGRFWSRGPVRSLYVPHGLLHAGTNTIVVFETEGTYQDVIRLSEGPVADAPGEQDKEEA
jgi:beta-galactosidase